MAVEISMPKLQKGEMGQGIGHHTDKQAEHAVRPPCIEVAGVQHELPRHVQCRLEVGVVPNNLQARL